MALILWLAGGVCGMRRALPKLDAARFERLRDFLGHIVLVVLGEPAVGLECAGGVECAFRDDALALAEEIR